MFFNKLGLNGVDNARLWFTDVRIPRSHMLDAFSTVDSRGKFTSHIKGKRARFIKMADQLLSGRICIASMTLSSCKITLLNTLRYSQTRLGVSADGTSSTPLLDYQLQRNAILPLVAMTYALNLGLNQVKNIYADIQVNSTKSDITSRELIMKCCVIKPLIAWHTEHAVSISRERCGGQGYLACNRFGEVIASVHAAITAEGDNSVLMQKVAKEYLATVTSSFMLKQGLLSLLPGWLLRLFIRNRPMKLVRFRKRQLLFQLAKKMRKAKAAGKQAVFTTWMQQESDLVQAVAQAYGDHLVLRACKSACQQQQSALLNDVCELYELGLLQTSADWYLQQGLLGRYAYRQLKSRISHLCWVLSGKVEELIAGFNIPDHLIYAPIAKNWEHFNRQESDNQGELDSVVNLTPADMVESLC